MTPDTADPFARLRVIVAGGTSGIGLACVAELRRRGASVIAIGLPGPVSTSPASPDDTILADLTTAESVETAIDEAFFRLGGHCDALVHTVGGSARSSGDGLLAECSPTGWAASLRLNLDSAFFVLQASVRRMRSQAADSHGQRGAVAIVGSVLADSPSVAHFGTIGYAVAKAGLKGLVRHAAASEACRGIRVNMLKPGLVATPMAARAINDKTIAAFLEAKQPLTSGPVSAEACAVAILGLIDPRAVGLTGAILAIDGGWSLSDPYRPKDE